MQNYYRTADVSIREGIALAELGGEVLKKFRMCST